MIGRPLIVANQHATLTFGLPHIPPHINVIEEGELPYVAVREAYTSLATGLVAILTSVLLAPEQLEFANRLILTNAQMIREEIEATTEGTDPSV